MLTPDLEKLASVVDPETGMSPLYAAYQFVAFSEHSVQEFLKDAWLAGSFTEKLLHRGYSPDTQLGAAGTTLCHWHARQRQAHARRQVKDEMPPEGVDVLTLSGGRDIWVVDFVMLGHWHSILPVLPTDWWQPITPPPGVEGK